MASNVTFNGSTYSIPAEGDSGWGTGLSNYFTAISTGALQKTGGNFTLTAETNFGATYGLKSAYLKSQASNPSATGIIRLGNTEGVSWRNAGNSADLALTVSAGNLLQFNGSSVLMPGLGSIVNADVNASAAIAYSKLNLSGSIVNADVNASAAIAYSKLNLGTSIVNADINGSAAIAYSKLNLSTSIVNADINASAAIAYSKLNLTGAVLNADLAGSIAYSKLSLTGAILNADLAGSIAYSKLSLTGAILNADLAGSIADSKLSTISTASKVSNSATTATSANTASAIVARDGSGNFTAGTITAALTGTASGNTTYSANQYGVVVSGSANAMTVIAPDASTTKVLTSGGSSANPSWQSVAAAPDNPYELSNLGLAITVGSSAMTIALKQSDGSTDPSSGSAAVKVGVRSSTAATGSYVQRTVTAALSLVVSSGSTLGMTSGKQAYLWVYLIDSDGAGTMKIAVSQKRFDDGSIQSTTAEGGAGAADSGTILYSNSAYSNKAVRLIARVLISEATAGTWASTATEITLAPNMMDRVVPCFQATVTGSKTLAPNATAVKVAFDTVSGGKDTHSMFDTTNNRYYIPENGDWYFETSIYMNATNILANRYDIRLYKNGSLARLLTITNAPASTIICLCGGGMLPDLVAGDYIEIFIYGAGNNSSSTISTDNGLTTVSFSGFRLGH